MTEKTMTEKTMTEEMKDVCDVYEDKIRRFKDLLVSFTWSIDIVNYIDKLIQLNSELRDEVYELEQGNIKRK